MSKRRDTNTLDMFNDWQPPKVAVSLPPEVTSGGNLCSQIARAISRALKNCDMSRDEIAQEMTDYLGEKITKNMLDAYASEGRSNHKITWERVIALVYATGQHGLLGFMAEPFDLAVVPAKYSDLIELHYIEEQEKHLAHQKATRIARWKSGR